MIYESLTVAFWIVAISFLNATIIASLMIGLAVALRQRRPAISHAILFGASLSLLALPVVVMVFRDQAWLRFAVETDQQAPLRSALRMDQAVGSVTASQKMEVTLTSENSTDAHQSEAKHPHYRSSEFDSNQSSTNFGRATIPKSVEKKVEIQSTWYTLSKVWYPVLAALWVIGCTCFSLRLVLAMVHLRRVSRRSSQPEKSIIELTKNLADQFEVRSPMVVVSKEVQQPMLWGVRRATVILPESCDSWSEQELIMILSHEMAHIQRGDHWSKIVNQVVLALYWFHPLVHLQNRLSESLAELSADDLCIVRGSKGIELSECLIKHALAVSRSAIALQFATYGELKARLERIVSDQHLNFKVGKIGRAIQVSLAAIVSVVLSTCIGLGESQNGPAIQNQEPPPLQLGTDERTIEGKILVDGEGKPGVEVAIRKGRNRGLYGGGSEHVGAYVARATTDSNGNYRIVIPESEHGHSTFHVIAPPELESPWRAAIVGLDNTVNEGPEMAFITKPGKETVRGKVLSIDGVPFEGAIVYLGLADHNMRIVSSAKQETRTVKTNQKGEFEFNDLVSTSYQLQAQSPNTNSLWDLVVRKICKAGDTDVVLIMDRHFLELPEKIVPHKRR